MVFRVVVVRVELCVAFGLAIELEAVVAEAFTGSAGFAVVAVLAKAAEERAAERRRAAKAVLVFMVGASCISGNLHDSRGTRRE